MIKETNIVIFKKSNIWRFEIKCGSYSIAGIGNSIEDAEKKAYSALTGMPNHDTIHIVYKDGKKPKPIMAKESK